MKIKNQFIVTLVIFALVLVVINFSVVYTNQSISSLENQQEIIENIQSTTTQLSLIANNYFLYQEPIELAYWQDNISAVYAYISELSPSNSQQAQMKNLIQSDTYNLNDSFSTTAIYLQNAPRNQSVRILPEFQAIWSQLTNSIQALSNSAGQLTSSLREESEQAHQANINLIVISLIIFAIYFFVNYLITYRTMLKSLVKLQDSIKVIGSGNLNHSVKADRKDEVGNLANSINQMAIQLRNLTAMLKEQERMAAIGQTAGMVGHDLRNPLQSIVGEVYLAQMELKSIPESDSKKELNANIQAISDQIAYMDKIVSDLQTFVKPVDVHKEAIILDQLINEVLTQLKTPTNIRVNKFTDRISINADPQLLRRVLINLTTNGIQAMPNGGILTVSTEHSDRGNIKIIVEDTGTGIPDDIKPKLFTPLFTTKSKGQGFGLAVCKRVIEAQGGTINFESQEGKGTKFIVELPLY